MQIGWTGPRAAGGLAAAAGAALGLAAATAPGTDAAPRVDLTAKGFAARDLATPVGRMTIYDTGRDDAPPLVFLHAISGGASSYHWRRVAPGFTDTHRVIAADLPGWGASDHPRRYLGFRDYTAAIEALLWEVGRAAGPRPVVVAESLAAGFAADVANRHPELVGGLVLLTPTGGRDLGRDAFKPQVRWTLGLLASVPGVDRLLYRAVFHRRGTYLGFWQGPGGYEHPRDVEPDLVDATWWSGTRPGAAFSVLPFLSGALRYDVASILRGVSVPAVAIWGTHEEFLDDDIKARLQALNPHIHNVTIELGRGYYLVAKPEETARAIAAALDHLSARAQTGDARHPEPKP